MRTIYKYPLASTISIPLGAEPLTVQVDQKTGLPTLWAMVETTAAIESRIIHMVGTGHDLEYGIPALAKEDYLGTVQIGSFVSHFFWSRP